jgi:ATP-dependent DNA helicase RecG
MLSPQVYKRLNEPSQYVRAKCFDRIQQEQMIITWLKAHPRITRSDVMELCGLSKGQASRLLISMTEKYYGVSREGVGKGTSYLWREL